MKVSAKDKDTGKESNIEIKGSSGLSPQEVERMRKDAEAHAADNKKKIEVITARNEAEHTIFQIDKTLKEHADKIDAGAKSAIEAAIERTRQAMKGDDAQAIKQATSDLKVAAQGLAEYVAGQGGPSGHSHGPQAGPAGDAKGGKDDVIDAEFEVKS